VYTVLFALNRAAFCSSDFKRWAENIHKVTMKNNPENILALQVVLHEVMLEKAKKGKVALYVDIAHRLPENITDDELQFAIEELVEKKYIIFEPGPGIRTRFLQGPFFSAWKKKIESQINLLAGNNTMVDLNKLNEMRFGFLKALYDESKGNSFNIVEMNILGKDLSFTNDDLDTVTKYLSDEGLLEYKTLGGGISITHYGIKEVEHALGSPKEPPEHSPPIVNITNIGSMNNSNLQQGNIQSSQTVETHHVSTENFTKLIQDLRQEIAQLKLSEQDKNDLELQIATLENQSKSSRKNPSVVQGTIDTISNILQGAAGSGLWQILNQIGALFM